MIFFTCHGSTATATTMAIHDVKTNHHHTRATVLDPHPRPHCGLHLAWSIGHLWRELGACVGRH